MSRSLRWILTGSLAGMLPVLVACTASAPPTPTPQPRPFEANQEQAYQARDYYFPSSGSMRAVYGFTMSVQVPPPNQNQSMSTTGRMTLEVANYSPTSATLRATLTGTDQSGQPRTSTSTTTLTVEADGTVVARNGGTERHSNALFTSMGDMVAPASGSEVPEIRGRLVGTETITVPAGTYQTVHIQEGPADPNAPKTDFWLARGVGIVRQRLEASAPAQSGQNQQVRTSFELRLESFTP